jgi:hypothetical protein
MRPFPICIDFVTHGELVALPFDYVEKGEGALVASCILTTVFAYQHR